MKTKRCVAALVGSLAFIGIPAHAAGGLSVSEEVSLPASADEVWRAIGDFGGLHTWHPAATKTDLTGSGSDAGDTRVLTLGDGATITEVLVDHDNAKMSYSYVITASPLPVKNYYSKLAVMQSGGNSAKVIWSSTFDAKGADDAAAIDAITGVYKGGFEALTQQFK